MVAVETQPVERPAALTVAEFRAVAARIEAEVGRVMVGQAEVVRDVLISVIGGGHVLLEGVPGLGKTMLVRTLADALDLEFSRIQFTPDLMPADITGTNILVEDQEGRRRFAFQRGPIFANLVLADEINRATPKTQSALLEAMQEQTVTIANVVHPLARPFFVLATQNPLEMEGTYPLPEAQLDRFFYKLLVRYPTGGELTEILRRTTSGERAGAEKAADGATIAAMGTLARQVPIATHVSDYVVRLVLATHPDRPETVPTVKRYVRYGASPRGAQAIVLGAKIRALVEGRLNVAMEDVRAVALPALRHRVLLNFEAEAGGTTSDEVLAGLLDEVSETVR
ncbi:MAG: FIG022979: MoxR-like ATPases [uncultured Thermomicrobiales bacterium]|uniref:FIG022979: MoxR-like ATPases n=1 Tax=uncultured Thermomicrobiales bacterium TaxID=1645740 RepID=A0A6J4VEU3_9BACT|nr:MAG: FIG022979: MoxR-like ATPases [uncultured Thermomicrobiales bacterium]